jgi:hypothetical protein
MKFAAHTDCLVLGVGDTEAEAFADAEAHGSEDETLLATCAITDAAAGFVIAHGDCRGLSFVDFGDETIIALRKR